MASLRLPLVISACILLAACQAHKPVRTAWQPVAQGPWESTATCTAQPVVAGDTCTRPVTPSGQPPYWQAGDAFACISIEQLRSASQGAAVRADAACYPHEQHIAATGEHEGFDLHVVEYDDEGIPWNPARVDHTVAEINTRLQQPAIVVTFLHGWQNNGLVCNGNLSCFREVLEILAAGEHRFGRKSRDRAIGLGMPLDVAAKTFPTRRVIGVYVAWRGKTNGLPTSFWGRKATAHKIGEKGAVTSLIESIRASVRSSAAPHQSSAVFIGHSFGGALLLSAVATSVTGALGRAEVAPETSDGKLLESNGDVFVLVNPAVEASRFENIYRQAMQVPKYHANQLPLLITVASEADFPVGKLFPLGQAVTTWARSARGRSQWQSMLQGVGMYTPYVTHRLEVSGPVLEDPDFAQGDCRCKSGLREIRGALLDSLDRIYDEIIAESATRLAAAKEPGPAAATEIPAAAPIELAAYQEFTYTRLEPVRPVDPNLPVMTVSAAKSVVDGHSGIFGYRFVDFLIEYVIKVERKRRSVPPQAAQSTEAR